MLNTINAWEKNLAERVTRDLSTGSITQDAARTFIATDVRPVAGQYAPLALLPAGATVDDVVRELRKDVQGQDPALRDVGTALVARRDVKTRTQETQKPIGCFLFTGPSASGKSQLTKAVARTFMQPEDLAAGRDPPVFKLDLNTMASLREYLEGGGLESGKECPLVDWWLTVTGGVIELAEVDKGPKDTWDVLAWKSSTPAGTSTKSGRTIDLSNFVLCGTAEATAMTRRCITVARPMPRAKSIRPRPYLVRSGALGDERSSKTARALVAASCAISVVREDGTGQVKLLANAKNVMEESAQAAVSVVRGMAEQLGIDAATAKTLATSNFTIGYTPAATPKDGPSAGITMATAVASAITGKTIPANIAMTGELSVHGDVQPVGGIREKVFAAVKDGVDTFIMCSENKKDF